VVTQVPGDPSREPSADLRVMARAFRDMYLALVAEGFTTSEAIQIIGVMIAQGHRGDGQ
jgi:hypothetical protein